MNGRAGRRWRYSIAGVALLGVLAAAAVAMVRQPSTQLAGTGKRMPSLELPLLDGKGAIRLDDLVGQPVVVNFWASWCAACRDEFPLLKATQADYRDRGVVVLGVLTEDRPAAATEFQAEMGADWPSVWDKDSAAAISFGVRTLPQTVFVGADGVIQSVHLGPVTAEILTDEVSELLSGGGP